MIGSNMDGRFTEFDCHTFVFFAAFVSGFWFPILTLYGPPPGFLHPPL